MASPNAPPLQARSLNLSPLLRLPAELRNTIYELALIGPADIVIRRHHSPPHEPGLLSTCRQIRNEARGIYYKWNRFRFHINNLDTQKMLDFSERSVEHFNTRKSLTFHGTPNWRNLRAWLRASFLGYAGIADSGVTEAAPGYLHSVAMCFAVMRKLKAQGMKWEVVASVLEDLHKGMAATDHVWI